MATTPDSATVPTMTPARSLAGAAAAIGVCLVVELFMLATRARMEAILTDFEIGIPLITALAISWALPVLLAVLLLVAVIKEFAPALRPVVNQLNAGIVLLASGCFVIYVVGTVMPLFYMMIGLS